MCSFSSGGFAYKSFPLVVVTRVNFLFDKENKYYSLGNILLIDLSIFIDLFN